MANVLEGWCTDPFGRHEARWFSSGSATALVRDGNAEGTDPVPDTPPTSEAIPIHVRSAAGSGNASNSGSPVRAWEAVRRGELVFPVALFLLGLSGFIIAVLQLQSPAAALLPIRTHAPYPQHAAEGTVTVIYTETGTGAATVFPFQVQYSVDGSTHEFVVYSSHTIVPVGANVTVAYDTRDPAKATLVGFTPAPKATMSSSARAAWQVIAVLGVGLVLKGLLGLLGVGVLQARSSRQLHPAAPIPLRPFYNQDPLQERRLRALQRRALPPTRSELILRVTWTVVFGAFSLGLGIYALDEGGGHFAPETVAGVLILLVALVSVSSSVRALQSRMRVGSSALIASSNSDA